MGLKKAYDKLTNNPEFTEGLDVTGGTLEIGKSRITSGGNRLFNWIPLKKASFSNATNIDYDSDKLDDHDYFRILGATYGFGASQVQFRLNNYTGSSYQYRYLDGTSIKENTSDDRFRVSGIGNGIIWFDYIIPGDNRYNANFAVDMDISIYGNGTGKSVSQILSGHIAGLGYRGNRVNSIQVLTNGDAKSEFVIYGADI